MKWYPNMNKIIFSQILRIIPVVTFALYFMKCTDASDNIQCQYTLVTKVQNNRNTQVLIIIKTYPNERIDEGLTDTTIVLTSGEDYVYIKNNSHYDRSLCFLHDEDYWQLCTGITAYHCISSLPDSCNDSIGYWFVYPDVDTTEFMPEIDRNTITTRIVEIQ